MKPRESLRQKFKAIGVLTVASQYIYNCLLFVRQNINNYKQRIDVSNRPIRNGGHKLVVVPHRLRKVQKSFVGLSVHFYNMIPKSVLDLPLHRFKVTVKKHLISRGYYTIEEFFNDKNCWNDRDIFPSLHEKS